MKFLLFRLNDSFFNPEVPLFTIHDSIVTKAKYQELVYSEMESVLENSIKATPSFEIELWK